MLSLWRRCSPRERRNFVGLTAFLVLAVLLGGGSRGDVASLPFVYGAAVPMVGAGLLQFGRADWARVRTPLLLLGALAGVMAVQLLPLPPSWWRALAGRGQFAAGLDVVGLGDVWRPASLTPDLTLYSLVALLVPLGVLLVGTMAGRMLPATVPVLLGLCALAALVGLLQAAGSLPSFYRVTNRGAAVGLFANRNHQAALLVCAFPLLAAWAAWPYADPAARNVRRWIGLCAGAALVPLLMVTGSRGGILFGAAAIVAALAVSWSGGKVRRSGERRRQLAGRSALLIAGVIMVVVLPAVVMLFLARDLAVQRLLGGSDGELRAQFLPVFFRMIGDFGPWGSGFGSFDAIFRGYEPHAALSPTYLNHAHNDAIELAIEGGVGALLAAAGFVAWVARRTVAAWRGRDGDRAGGESLLLARSGSVLFGVLLPWSLVDYPLRVPSLAAIAALACLYLADMAMTAASEPGLGRRAPIG